MHMNGIKYMKKKCSPISSGARQHLIDANNVEWMHTHADMELILAAVLDQVFVAANTSGFKGFRAQLFILVRHQVHTEWKIFDGSLLAAQIEDTDLRVWDTTAKPRFRVWLVFTVTIAAS